MKYFDYKENKQHGTFDFPIEFYHVTPNHSRYNMPYHWHTECEIIRILEGEFILFIDEDKIVARKNDLLFIHGGIFHGGLPNNCIYECIVFDMKLLLKDNHACTKQIYDIINHNKVIAPKLPSNIKDLNTCCTSLFESMRLKNIGYEFITQGSLYYLIGAILENKLYMKNDNHTKKTKERFLQFKNVITLIENEYQNPLTLEDLSRASGMSPKYFCRFFHEMSHKTPIEYLNYYRIEIACEQLLATELSITEIALNCGFNDVSYFIKTFKKYKGLTPKKYLKSLDKPNLIN
ncbi:MAG: helix-turn-helix domain-containing protein [Clostridium baratii]|uniref:Helix-turn-helix domain protein n=1 Tax=Clostridium baratii str. Sullivan TaxID=1415775 RepID=A0A0A7FVX1_9CLOT|nr:AraC family transcriptional regulator [Clostridium baratii]AIY83759.1 helix-turn-helix domain protein [Clostridium baratii str. Sullivan]MBS6007615.1 helix-turn-helix domain-containing protein [Clostridium baratii]MDU1054392.1 helix-turn-helix domain-containing protein [Clostridium baratii]MDU4911616.1 helix-turn-helix domain-containing protein [Clostridium baratii]